MRRVAIGALLAVAIGSLAGAAAQQAPDGPQYVNGNNLVRPANYREWPFVGAGLDMVYEEGAPATPAPQQFTSVFVNPSAHKAFMQSGKWPDGSVFVLEFRRAGNEAALNGNKAARYQTDLVGLEAEVKDSRFPDGWAYFNFGRGNALRESTQPLAGEQVARCVECHTQHTAVERTFVQFYPTLLEVARKMGTVKPGH